MNRRHPVSLLTLMIMLTLSAFQPWQNIEPKPNAESRLRFGLFSHRDAGPLHSSSADSGTISEPEILWTKIRHNFGLIYPEKHPRVQKYVNEFSRNNFYMNKLGANAQPFLHMITEEVHRRNIPLEITLLPMVESNFEPQAVSRTGAGGLWQIMPDTGRVLGLKQDFWYDGRLDVRASTLAALSHLQYLHRLFEGDWLHALAAYNSGERRVQRAIAKNKRLGRPTDFWHLDLPKETENYVPKLLALASIVKNPDKHGVRLPAIMNKQTVEHLHLHHQVDLSVAANLAQWELKELIRLNPALKQGSTHPKGPHQLLVPSEIAHPLTKEIRRLPAEQLTENVLYKVRPGDNLSTIAKSHKTTVTAIHQMNDIDGRYLHPGLVLYLPKYVAKPIEKPSSHIVKRGDSLWGIAKQHNVAVADLKKWNHLDKDNIKIGQKLVIVNT